MHWEFRFQLGDLKEERQPDVYYGEGPILRSCLRTKNPGREMIGTKEHLLTDGSLTTLQTWNVVNSDLNASMQCCDVSLSIRRERERVLNVFSHR